MTSGSATVNKDFRVKHGLVVAQGGTFGSPVVVGTPTENTHAATKLYVDSQSNGLEVSATAPVSPSNGDLWFDTVTTRIYVYYSSEWIALATLADAEVLQEHIHDTTAGGTGKIATIFVDAEYYYSAGNLVSAGFYNTTTWDSTFNDEDWYILELQSENDEIAQHIHNTSIDGTGLIVTTFVDSGSYYEISPVEDAGLYSTQSWISTYDGGISTDLFN